MTADSACYEFVIKNPTRRGGIVTYLTIKSYYGKIPNSA